MVWVARDPRREMPIEAGDHTRWTTGRSRVQRWSVGKAARHLSPLPRGFKRHFALTKLGRSLTVPRGWARLRAAPGHYEADRGPSGPSSSPPTRPFCSRVAFGERFLRCRYAHPSWPWVLFVLSHRLANEAGLFSSVRAISVLAGERARDNLPLLPASGLFTPTERGDGICSRVKCPRNDRE